MSGTAVRNALTVDVEDWFQVSNFDHVVRRDEWDRYPSRVVANTRRLLDIFDETGARATCFVLGWVAERFPELIAEIRERGHDIASHGFLHELVHTIGPDRFARDVERSVEAIERACGVRPIGYRAPSFSIGRRSLWALEILAAHGFEYDSSVYPVRHPRYGIPAFSRTPCRVRTPSGAEIREFPLTTLRVLGRNLGASGGAYLRILPPAVLRRAFRAMNARGEPAVLYIHPWEVDPDQPRIKTGNWGGLTHYANLRGTAGRLRGLLSSFRFAPMAEALRGAPGLAGSPVEVGA
jgi:polysaccharide deacetylase family protein (PEP-CTERM system associated)